MIETYGKIAAIAIAIMGTFIKIPKIEFNLWELLLRKVGAVTNGEVLKRLDTVEATLNKHLDESQKERIRATRTRILDFNDRVCIQEHPTKEHWNEIIEDIGVYQQYCKEHPEYPNKKAEIAMAHLVSQYEALMEQGAFVDEL